MTPDPAARAKSVLGYITTVQRDGRLLLRHVARRSDRALPDDVPAGTTREGTPSDVLFADPVLVIENSARLAELFNTVDVLSRRAAPANVRSIRLTSAYLKIAVEDNEPPEDIKAEAARVKSCMWLVAGLAIVMFSLSVGLLAHVDYGRRMLQQLGVLRQQEQVVDAALRDVPADAWVGGGRQKAGAATNEPAGQLCGPATALNAMDKDASWLEPKTQKVAALCRQHDDLLVRLDMIYIGLADWNCRTNVILHAFRTNSCGRPAVELPASVKLYDWQSHETRVSATTAVVAGFVLPMMLGFLGGSVYALRRLDRKLSSWSLEPHDGKHALVRVGLAALLGGLVGVVWSSDESVRLGGFTLSLAALAFFIGFSVEAVFSVIESLIGAVTAGIRNPNAEPPAPAGRTPLSVAEIRAIAVESAMSDTRLPPGGATGAGAASAVSGAAASAVSGAAASAVSGAAASAVSGAAASAVSGAAAPAASQADLAQLSRQLQDQRQSLAAIARLDAGSQVAPGAAALVAAIDRTLQGITPLLSGTPDAARLGQAAGLAASTLALAENAGLPGLLADAVATLKGVADFARPVLAGIPGGPLGIIGGIVLGGIKLRDNQQQFDALKVALMNQPFDPTLPPRVPTATTALAALDAAPLMAERVEDARDPVFAMALMQVLMSQGAAGGLMPSTDLAAALMHDAGPVRLAGRFDSMAELVAAIDEYRGGIVFAEASNKLTGSVDLPRLDGTPPSSLSLQSLAKAVFDLHADPRASAAIERVVALTQALTSLPGGPQVATDLVVAALGKVANIVKTARQTES